MKIVRITVMRTAHCADLIERYENPIQHACNMRKGQVFTANGWQRPERDLIRNHNGKLHIKAVF